MRTLSACAVASQNIRLIVSRKRIFDPFNPLFIESIKQHAIETAIAFRLAGQIVAGGENNASAFGDGDAGAGATKIAAAAQTDFDENQRLAITANQVDLAATHQKIALHNA